MCHSIINTTSKPFKSTVVIRSCVSLEWLASFWRRRSLEMELPIVFERERYRPNLTPETKTQTKRDISLSLEISSLLL